jgi:hypothetical protein
MRRRRTLVCLPRIENLDPRAAKVFEVSVGQSGTMATADGGDLRIEPNNRQARTMKAGISAAESLVMNWRRRCCAADLGMSAVVPSASSARAQVAWPTVTTSCVATGSAIRIGCPSEGPPTERRCHRT